MSLNTIPGFGKSGTSRMRDASRSIKWVPRHASEPRNGSCGRGSGQPPQVAHEQRLGQLGAQAGELVELLEAGAHAIGVGGAQLRREHLLDQARLALDRRVDRAQMARVEAVALQASGRGDDLHVLGPEAPGLGGDQAELLEAADELLVDAGGADQLAEARAAGGAGADRAAARALAGALGGLLELVADHAQRQELVALQAQDRAQALDVLLREEAVAAARALRMQQPLLLEVADLRDRDVGVLDAQRGADRADRQAPAAHGCGHGVFAHRSR